MEINNNLYFKPHPKPKTIKGKLYNKYKGRCYYCGNKLINKDGVIMVSLDHVIPKSRGGKNNITNYLPSCASCNSSKATKTLDEFRFYSAIKKRFENEDINFSIKQIEWLHSNGYDMGVKINEFYGEKIDKKILVSRNENMIDR